MEWRLRLTAEEWEVLKYSPQRRRLRLGEHDVQLACIYDAIENLLDEKADQKNWEDRERIGFKR
jgi:hypothetical protein